MSTEYIIYTRASSSAIPYNEKKKRENNERKKYLGLAEIDE
jgi:hypothetical protein